jgi:hypothetical protein
MLQCGNCGSRFHRRSHGCWYVCELVVWSALGYLVVWRHDPSLPLGLVIVAALVVPFNAAFERLRSAVWLWRHPLRCKTRRGRTVPAGDAG